MSPGSGGELVAVRKESLATPEPLAVRFGVFAHQHRSADCRILSETHLHHHSQLRHTIRAGAKNIASDLRTSLNMYRIGGAGSTVVSPRCTSTLLCAIWAGPVL
jgi:hypothetical protein